MIKDLGDITFICDILFLMPSDELMGSIIFILFCAFETSKH